VFCVQDIKKSSYFVIPAKSGILLLLDIIPGKDSGQAGVTEKKACPIKGMP